MRKIESLPELNGEFKYKAVVFDLDGTLYNQTKLRLNMAVRLGLYYVSHPFRIKELFVLKYFREVRDKWDEIRVDDAGVDDAQYAYVGGKKGVSAEYVERVVKKWIYDNPLDLLGKYRNERLHSYIEGLQAAKIPVVIFSDYPIEDKIAALSIKPDGMYCPGDERNIDLKPSPMGLELILNDFALAPEEILMVGDRDEKDGEAARRAGVDYYICSF